MSPLSSAFGLLYTTVAVTQSSSWIIEGSFFSSKGAALTAFVVIFSQTSISSGSVMAVEGCIFACTVGFGFSLSSQSVVIADSSEWRIVDCELSGALRGLSLDKTTVLVESLSSWVVLGCTGVVTAGAVISLVSSAVIVSGESAFVISSNKLTGAGGGKGNPGVLIDSKSPIAVQGGSLWMVHNNTLQATSSSCFAIAAIVTLENEGSARLVDNTCSASSASASCFTAELAAGGGFAVDSKRARRHFLCGAIVQTERLRRCTPSVRHRWCSRASSATLWRTASSR